MSFIVPILSLAEAAKYGSILLVVLAVIYLCQNELSRWKARIDGLPGPRGYPIVGSLLQVCCNHS